MKALAVILFAFSSMIIMATRHGVLFGRGKPTEYFYKIIFCIFTVIGAAVTLGAVIDFSDAMIFAMLVPNRIGHFLLTPKVALELKRYRKLIRIGKKGSYPNIMEKKLKSVYLF